VPVFHVVTKNWPGPRHLTFCLMVNPPCPLNPPLQYVFRVLNNHGSFPAGGMEGDIQAAAAVAVAVHPNPVQPQPCSPVCDVSVLEGARPKVMGIRHGENADSSTKNLPPVEWLASRDHVSGSRGLTTCITICLSLFCLLVVLFFSNDVLLFVTQAHSQPHFLGEGIFLGWAEYNFRPIFFCGGSSLHYAYRKMVLVRFGEVGG